MNGTQIILLTIATLLVLPALTLIAARACVYHVISGKNYVEAYLTILLTALLAALVLHLLPQVPTILRALATAG